MILEINKIKANPIHAQLYLTNDIDDLADSIQESGLLEKIVVNKKDFVLISGYRRLLALKKLNYKEVDVIVKDFAQDDESLTLISYNKQRNKTNREKLKEAIELKKIWGKRRGRKSKSDQQNNDSSGPVNTRKKISEELKISEGQLSMLEFINDTEPELIDCIDKGEHSVPEVYKKLKAFEAQKKMLNMEKAQPTTITDDWYTIYNKSSDDLSDIEDCSVQTVITSPPYFKQRSFTDNSNELGAENTSEEFVQRMANHLHTCYRVLKPEGNFFLNLGDTFVDKCLQSIPHRVAIELVKKGWILRNSITWKKSNTLPSSSTDNLTTSYELIFHFVKNPKYYYKIIPMPLASIPKVGIHIINQKRSNEKSVKLGSMCLSGLKDYKKLEDFWTEDVIETAGASQSIVKKYGGVNHPAPFPTSIVTPLVLCSSQSGDVVLDLFSGTATTGRVAILLGRKYIGYELNPNYNDIQTKILNDAVKTFNDPQQSDDLSQAA